MSDFIGSIAQTKLSFTEVIEVLASPGDNYKTPMYFINDTDAANNLVDVPGSLPATVTVNAGNFGTLTKGPLLGQLTPFFQVAGSTNLIIVVWASESPETYAGLTSAFNAFHELGYFKLIFETGTAGAAQIALGQLCAADTLLSAPVFVGTSDTGCYASPATGIAAQLAGASPAVEANIFYSAQSGINPALVQIGLTLGTLNVTGTPVGNRFGYIATLQVFASGTTGGTDNTNLSAVQQAHLQSNKISYFLTVGDGTGAVAALGEVTTFGNDTAAQWTESYINYVAQTRGANLITHGGTNPFYKNNTAYQAILALLNTVIQPFQTLGRLSNLAVTKTPFSGLPVTGPNNITIPNAWSADWNGGLESVTVQGTLFVQAGQ